MAVKILNTQDWKVNGIKCAVCGFSGVGKTKLLATAPNPIIISAEKGLLSLARESVPYIDVSSFQDVQDAFDYLAGSDEAKQYQTIGYDSLSETCEQLLGFHKKKEKDGRRAYMKMADSIGELIRKIRDLPDKHVVFTSKMIRKDNEEDGTWWYEPMLPGRVLPNGLPYFVDEVFCMQVANDGTRFLQTNNTPKITCKDRAGVLDENERPDLTSIFNKIQEMK